MSDVSQTRLEFFKLTEGSEDTIALLLLNRPESANAFSARMMEEIAFHVKTVERRPRCRALVVSGVGKHFSAGADLNWMRSAAGMSYSENLKESQKLVDMFEAVASLSIAKICAVRGAIYGGAVGLVAACDYAVADEKSQFCLSEAKLGLLPAVIAPYLGRKMTQGGLRRFALSSRVFTASDAKEVGLIELIAPSSEFVETVVGEVTLLLSCGFEAQRSLNALLSKLRGEDFKQSSITLEAISKARVSPEGQAGLSAFFEKRLSPWTVPVPESFKVALNAASSVSGANKKSP